MNEIAFAGFYDLAYGGMVLFAALLVVFSPPRLRDMIPQRIVKFLKAVGLGLFGIVFGVAISQLPYWVLVCFGVAVLSRLLINSRLERAVASGKISAEIPVHRFLKRIITEKPGRRSNDPSVTELETSRQPNGSSQIPGRDPARG